MVDLFSRKDLLGHGVLYALLEWGLRFLQLVLIVHSTRDEGQVGLQDHAAHHQLVEDVMHLVSVEDEVELAHVLERFVERFNEDVNEIEDAQLAFRRVHAKDEVERGVVSVDELGVAAPLIPSLHEIAHEVRPLRHQVEALSDQLLLLIDAMIVEKLTQSRLAMVVDDEDSINHGALSRGLTRSADSSLKSTMLSH